MPSTEGQFLGLNQMIHCIYKYFAIPFKCIPSSTVFLLMIDDTKTEWITHVVTAVQNTLGLNSWKTFLDLG